MSAVKRGSGLGQPDELLAIVAIEEVLLVALVRDEEIEVSVVVEVAPRASRGEALVARERFKGDLDEAAAVVAVKPVLLRRGLLGTDVVTVGNEEILVSIRVVIDPAEASCARPVLLEGLGPRKPELDLRGVLSAGAECGEHGERHERERRGHEATHTRSSLARHILEATCFAD